MLSSTWCNDIKTSIQRDSKWKASILYPSKSASMINAIIPQSSIKKNNPKLINTHVDIVDIMNPSNSMFLEQFMIAHNFPKNALFEFEGYNSIGSSKNLLQSIKQAAFENGTILNNNNIHKKSSKHQFHSITLVCGHFGKPSAEVTSTKNFKDGCIQANDTIIQQAHYSSSIKNRSRNSQFQRVNSSSSKANRSNTKKCVCLFQFTIMFDDIQCKWFLKRRKEKSDTICYHTNHVYINPSHMSRTKNIIDPNVFNTISNCIQSGISTTNIVQLVHSQHNQNIDYQTIHNLKLNHVNKLITECGGNPASNAVDELIKIFESIENVSFTYILHNYNSGFVTYRKNRNENQKYMFTNTFSHTNDNYFHNSVKKLERFIVSWNK